MPAHTLINDPKLIEELQKSLLDPEAGWKVESRSWTSESEGSPNFSSSVSITLTSYTNPAKPNEPDYIVLKFRVGEAVSVLVRQFVIGERLGARGGLANLGSALSSFGFQINSLFFHPSPVLNPQDQQLADLADDGELNASAGGRPTAIENPQDSAEGAAGEVAQEESSDSGTEVTAN